MIVKLSDLLKYFARRKKIKKMKNKLFRYRGDVVVSNDYEDEISIKYQVSCIKYQVSN